MTRSELIQKQESLRKQRSDYNNQLYKVNCELTEVEKKLRDLQLKQADPNNYIGKYIKYSNSFYMKVTKAEYKYNCLWFFGIALTISTNCVRIDITSSMTIGPELLERLKFITQEEFEKLIQSSVKKLLK